MHKLDGQLLGTALLAAGTIAWSACAKKEGPGDGQPEGSARDGRSEASDAKATEAAPPAESSPLRVAGASDLVFVMEDIVKRFESETREKVDFIPGSSGKLAAQIREG